MFHKLYIWTKLIRMHLVMAIGEKILERMAVDGTLLKDQEYLEACRVIIGNKHWLTVTAYQEKPQFYLEVASAARPARRRGRNLN